MVSENDLLGNFHINLNFRRNYFCQLTVHGVRQTDMSTAKLLLPKLVPSKAWQH